MSKPKNTNSFSGQAVTTMKVNDGSGLLAVSVKLTIVNGSVTTVEIMNSPNLPAAAVGQAQTALWAMLRSQTVNPENLRVGVQQ